ncbi:hypothetical protein ACFYN5_28905 [Streptomyces sp. NPDC007126]|uniref:Uncharacterized protein n=1 Tax=Streptomyces salinarius TaxID=2762598 RepID=A0ABW8B7D4_9ACTN|nr:hypothetical protein [Streptomyces sp. SID10362]NDZ73436.1 hypothetical protein [Streptomyces sp. SID10362]
MAAEKRRGAERVRWGRMMARSPRVRPPESARAEGWPRRPAAEGEPEVVTPLWRTAGLPRVWRAHGAGR